MGFGGGVMSCLCFSGAGDEAVPGSFEQAKKTGWVAVEDSEPKRNGSRFASSRLHVVLLSFQSSSFPVHFPGPMFSTRAMCVFLSCIDRFSLH